jgi:hypothetical protein
MKRLRSLLAFVLPLTIVRMSAVPAAAVAKDAHSLSGGTGNSDGGCLLNPGGGHLGEPSTKADVAQMRENGTGWLSTPDGTNSLEFALLAGLICLLTAACVRRFNPGPSSSLR